MENFGLVSPKTLGKDNGLNYCPVCMCYSHRKHNHAAKPTLKELFNKEQLTGYLKTAHSNPLTNY